MGITRHRHKHVMMVTAAVIMVILLSCSKDNEPTFNYDEPEPEEDTTTLTPHARLLDANHTPTGIKLYSAKDNGLYQGFVYVGESTQWYFELSDGTTFGCDDDGSPFAMKSGATSALIFPATNAVYFLSVDAHTLKWEAVKVGSLRMSGDYEGEFIYDIEKHVWMIEATATPGVANVAIFGHGQAFNELAESSGTLTDFGFVGSSNALEYASEPIRFPFDISIDGDVVFTLDLTDPRGGILTASEAIHVDNDDIDKNVTVPESEKIYIGGIDDRLTGGSWNFRHYLIEYNRAKMAYGGVASVDCNWGYYIYPIRNNFEHRYAGAPNSSWSAGRLIYGGADLITPPPAGLYLFDVSLVDLSYALTEILTVGLCGLDSDCSHITPMTKTGTPGIYAAEFTKTGRTAEDVKICINGDPNIWFGGNGQILRRNGPGIAELKLMPDGDYTLVADLTSGIYKIYHKRNKQ